MLFNVRHLMAGRPKPLTIRRTDGIERVLSLMTEHDFSQVPVVDENERPSGLVTMKSIIKAANSLGFKVADLDLKVVMDKARKIGLDDDMHELLNQTKRNESVLVVDCCGKLVGILTHYDTTHFFRKRIEDMLLVEDIEKMVKKLVQWVYAQTPGERGNLAETIDLVTNPARQARPKFEQAIKAYVGKAGFQGHQVVTTHLDAAFARLDIPSRVKDFENLTLSDYTEILIQHSKCPKLGPKAGPSELKGLLHGVREVRNKLMHFRGEVTAQERDRLRSCKKWFEGIDMGSGSSSDSQEKASGRAGV